MGLRNIYLCITNSTENAIHPKYTISRKAKFSVQIQLNPKSQCILVLLDLEESEFLDLVDFGEGAFSEETVIPKCVLLLKKCADLQNVHSRVRS